MSLSVSGWKRVPEEMRKRSFELWIQYGRLSTVTRTLKEEGWRNSSGRPYAESQISVQAKIYLLEHWKDENLIVQFNKDRNRNNLPDATQTEFEEYLVLTAVNVWGRRTHVSRFWDWIEDNNFENYSYVWANRDIKPRPVNQPKRGTLAESNTMAIRR